jgi:hypothetical protein
MSSVYRVTKSTEAGAIVDTVAGIEAYARDRGPGRYHVDEHATDPFPGSHCTSRAWGVVIHQKDGEVILNPHPWPR